MNHPWTDREEEKIAELLVELAFEREESFELQEVLSLPLNSSEFIKPESLQNIWKQFEKKERKANRRSVSFWVKWAVDLAAALIILATAIAPIAIANNEWIKAQIYQFVIESREHDSKAFFNHEQYESFTIPSTWKGTYFLSYIPSDMKIVYEEPLRGDAVTYRSSEKEIVFRETGVDGETWIDTEGADSELAVIHHIPSIVYHKQDSEGRPLYAFLMIMDNRYLLLSTTNCQRSEAYQIAESVRNIQ